MCGSGSLHRGTLIPGSLISGTAMTPPHHSPADPAPDDAHDGADLLAYVRGELEPARAAEIEAHLSASPTLRSAHEQLAADHETWSRALNAEAPQPLPETLETLLATISDEAAERRAAVAIALSPVAAERGADAVALAMDVLAPDESKRVADLVASDARLADEVAAARDLATATRAAFALNPLPETLPRLLAEIAAVGPAPVQFDSQDIPAPAHRPPGRLRLLGWLAPLAAAAVLFMALQPTPPGSAHVREGIAVLGHRNGDNGASHEAEWVDATDGAFDLDYGSVIGARGGPLTIRVACGAAGGSPSFDGPLEAGEAEFALEPGARLARIDAAHFELLEGRLRVAAHELGRRLEVRAGVLYATATGTRFDVASVDGRLFVIVEEGSVRLGRRGAAPAERDVHAGEQGLVDAERLTSGPLDGRSNGDAFLTPRALLSGGAAKLRSGAALEIEAELAIGDGGPVYIAGFDASAPLFLVRLKGPEGREHEVKVQESMLTSLPPTDPTPDIARHGAWHLTAERPYRLSLRIPGLDLEPGRWEARLRYMSYSSTYSARSPVSPWLGATESAPISFEVMPR